MTTDTKIKLATTALELPGPDGVPVTVTVSGIAKGVGMIHPRMATMLGVVLTDASVAPATLHGLLSPDRPADLEPAQRRRRHQHERHRLPARVRARAGAVRWRPASPEAAALGGAIEAVARSLARQQAADGEGATTLITCQVSGAADDYDARAIARSVVSSSLLKAAVHGRDPNWGRVASAAGNARLPDEQMLEAAGLHHTEAMPRAGRRPELDLDELQIAIAGTLVFDGHSPALRPRRRARGDGRARGARSAWTSVWASGTGEAFGCDLTEGYVIENAEYTT